MTDKPYGLDFFDKIVDVHWGSGSWLFVHGEVIGYGGNAHVFGITANFNDTANGSPGFTLVTGGGTSPFPPGGPGPVDHTFTNADFTHGLKTGGGAPMVGIGIGYGQGGGSNIGTTMALNLSKFPSRVFKVSFSIQFVPSFAANNVVSVGTVKKLKAGDHLSTLLYDSQQQTDATFNGGSAVFKVDPKTLQVTGPFPF